MKYRYKDKIAVLVNGKMVHEFVNKAIKPMCETLMSRWVVINLGYEYGSFEIMKMGS